MANLGSVSALTTYVDTNIEDNTSNSVTPAIITRYAQGDYRIEFPDGFDISKLHMIVSPTWEADEQVGTRLTYSGGNVLQLSTMQHGLPGDDLMFGGIHVLLTKGV